tara:strand:+ start:216 stop:563 length:348 start_codon:yes stop_codon:yes gene_type:complete
MKLNIGLNSAYDEIVDTYSQEELHEIVSHGCQSGVCHEHIYYGDTIKFFDTYEDEITDYLTTRLGDEVLIDLFSDANASLDHYKNSVTWSYIELVASEIIDTTNEYEQDAQLVLS